MQLKSQGLPHLPRWNIHVVSRSTRAKCSLPSLWNKLPRKGASSLARHTGLKSQQPFYRQQVKLPGCLCQRQSPGKIYGGQNKCAQRHVHTEVSLLWSCLLVGFGVGLQRCSRTGLGGGGESSKQKGALLQPSSLICPITIKHSSWHLNSPPRAWHAGSKAFFLLLLFSFCIFTFEYLQDAQKMYQTVSSGLLLPHMITVSFENRACTAAAVQF